MTTGGKTVRRRTLLAGVAAGLAMPAIRDSARAAGGKVRLMTWSGYEFKDVKAAFESQSGMTLEITALPDQDAMAAQMKANGGEGFDVAEPTADRVADWQTQGFLQPMDETKAKIDGLNPAFLSGVAADTAKVDGKRYASPTVWGTEAIMFDTAKAPESYPTASYADLWAPEHAGKMTIRAHSGLVGIGLMLEGQGKLPHKMRDSFTDPSIMDANYAEIMKFALAHKANIAQFWSDENTAQGAFRSNGVIIGQNWDTSAAALMKDKQPIGYVAPKEGALAWLQNFVIPAKANTDASYAFIAWMNTPKASALWATAYSANPTASGADKMVDQFQVDFLAKAYPGDALSKLFWWPSQATWFVKKRTEYSDQLQSA